MSEKKKIERIGYGITWNDELLDIFGDYPVQAVRESRKRFEKGSVDESWILTSQRYNLRS